MTACLQDPVSFHNGEATIDDGSGNVLNASVGLPDAGRIWGNDYVVVDTWCSAGSTPLALVSVYKADHKSGTFNFVRNLDAPESSRAFNFSKIELTSSHVKVTWNGFSSDAQPMSDPDIEVTVAYDVSGKYGGDGAPSVLRVAPPFDEMPMETTEELIEVPSYLGLSNKQVMSLMARVPLNVAAGFPNEIMANDRIYDWEYCDVVLQSVRPGSMVKRGTTISLRFCKVSPF